MKKIPCALWLWMLAAVSIMLGIAGCGSSLGLQGQGTGGVLPVIAGPPAPPARPKPLPEADQYPRTEYNPQRTTVSINLTAGWNTISFPLKTVTASANFPYYLYKFNGTGYDEINPREQYLQIDCRYGYWTYAASASTITVTGEPNADPGMLIQVDLNYGWNLIGIPHANGYSFNSLNLKCNEAIKPLPKAAAQSIPPESGKWLYQKIYEYNSNDWQVLSALEGTNNFVPSTGYWLWSWENMILRYSWPRGISCGYLTSLGVKPDGSLRGWGGNTYGQIGDATYAEKYYPVSVQTLIKFTGSWGYAPNDIFATNTAGTIWHYNGNIWEQLTADFGRPLYGIWGTSPQEIFAIGDNGFVTKFNGSSWTSSYAGTSNLFGIWGTSGSNIYAVGAAGSIKRYNGTSWINVSSGTSQNLYAVWGASAQDIFAVGAGGTIRKYNGTSWSGMSSGTSQNLYAVWGASANNVVAVGELGTILHYNGTSWNPVTSNTTQSLYAVWGASGDLIFTAGSSGVIKLYNGNSWEFMTTDNTQSLFSLWGMSANEVVALGNAGTVMHYNGTNWNAMNAAIGNPPVLTYAASGSYHSLALSNDGKVYSWGGGGVVDYGQLGYASDYNSPHYKPVEIPNLTGISAIACGSYHSLALQSDGTVWAWGRNQKGQLGDGGITDRYTPERVKNSEGTGYLTDIVAIAAGGDANSTNGFSVALQRNGQLWAWGDNTYGQLGNGSNNDSKLPVAVVNLSNVQNIACGAWHTLALDENARIWAWGRNFYGQLGLGNTSDTNIPSLIPNFNNVYIIAGGGQHSLAVKTDGSAWAWGFNNKGQLGDGSIMSKSSPVLVPGLNNVLAVAGSDHSLALTSDNKVWAWGSNSNGQIGIGSWDYNSHPTPYLTNF